jgi:transcriptional regulator
MHGWAVSERIQQISENVLQVNQGSLYPALHRLEHQGWIKAGWGVSELGCRARFYRLTPSGRKQLEREAENWDALSALERRSMPFAAPPTGKAGTLLVGAALILGNGAAARSPQAGRAKLLDLAESFAAGELRAVNRDVTKVPDCREPCAYRNGRPGIVWIEESDLTEDLIEPDVRDRDQFQRSFARIAFYRKDDNTHEAAYVRPFNFRAQIIDRGSESSSLTASRTP